jgi:hypothetical protein
MSNNLLKISKITNEALMVLENELEKRDSLIRDARLQQLKRTEHLLHESLGMLDLIGCSPEGIDADIANAQALQARIRAFLMEILTSR